MRSLFRRACAPQLGVDVSASSIKVVELSLARTGAYVVEHCAIEPLERGWVVDGTVERFGEVAAALRRAVRRSGSKARHAVLALPPSAVITRTVILPAGLSALEREVQVEAEASQYIPFPLEDVSLDFSVLAREDAAQGGEEVLIAASRRERVQDCVGLARSASLKATVVDVEAYAARLAAVRLIGRWLPAQPEPLRVALFEIGAASTRLHVLCGGEAVFERDQSFGGDQLTRLLVRQYGFSLAQAEHRKRGHDWPGDAARTVLPVFVEGMAQDIGRSLQFVSASMSGYRLDGILLAGGSACVPGLEEAVAGLTSLACRRADPFEGMVLGKGVHGIQARRQALFLSDGLWPGHAGRAP